MFDPQNNIKLINQGLVSAWICGLPVLFKDLHMVALSEIEKVIRGTLSAVKSPLLSMGHSPLAIKDF